MMFMPLAFFGGEGDWTSQLIWLAFFMVFIFFAPRLMVTQTILKLEKDVAELEGMAKNARDCVVKAVSKKPTANLKEAIRNFMEFFAISPVSLDPYGIVKKLDHIIRNSEQRFKYFVKEIAPNLSIERQRNIKNALAGAITTHEIAKLVRHFLEIVKKYKLFQLGMILQMQIPLVARIAKASMHATHAFAEGSPIGDGIGPLVAANMIKDKYKKFEKEEFILFKTKINGKDIFITKSDGPGASTGYPGKFLKKFFKRNRINRIITIDAGMKLEGEKPGSIAEGVGVAIGGSGVDRYEIEEICVQKNIPLDAVVVKVSDEEALMPMGKEIVNSVSNAIDIVKKNIKREKKKEKILIIGVGNTCGIGNNIKEAKESEKIIRKNIKKAKKEKKKGWF